MASIEKFTASAVPNELRHALRQIRKNSNLDIDRTRTKLNQTLSPERELSPFLYYKQRLSEVFHYNRKDLITLAGIVITCPKEITDMEQQTIFFKTCHQFLCKRFDERNIILSKTHYDEGRDLKSFDENGNLIYESHVGAPHLHVYVMPICRFKKPKNKKINKRKRPADMDNFKEHCCAREVLNRNFFRNFHPDLQAYLDSHLPFQCSILNGATERQGGNRTVAQLKERYEELKNLVPELMRENESLRERVSTLEHELEQARNMTQEHTWGNDPTWDTQRIGGYEWEPEFT